MTKKIKIICIYLIFAIVLARAEQSLCVSLSSLQLFPFHATPLNFFMPSNTHLVMCACVCKFPRLFVELFTLLKFSGWLNLFSSIEPFLCGARSTSQKHVIKFLYTMIILGQKVFNESKEIFINSDITYMLILEDDLIENIFIIRLLFFFPLPLILSSTCQRSRCQWRESFVRVWIEMREMLGWEEVRGCWHALECVYSQTSLW